MKRTSVEEVAVLVVGAGPAGVTAAATLARYGVGSILVERRATLSDLPRATVASTGSMELLRSWSLEEQVRAAEVDVDERGWIGETLTSPDGTTIPLGLPSREQAAAFSPTGPVCVAQDDLEPVLLRHVRELGRTDVRFATELVGLEPRADGVEAVLRDAAGMRIVRARFVVGADGAHSVVRAALGITMRGPGRVLHAVSALFRAPLWELLGDRRHLIYPVTHAEAEGTFVPSGRGDRWIYGVRDEPDTLDFSAYDAETMTRLIRLGVGVADLEPRIERIGRFSFTAELADSFGDGSVFLVGDAAHRVTPRGGTGMNTAIRDGHDLGWKLAWVLAGWAGVELLDSYEAERRPVAEHNLARSVDPNGSLREVSEELHVDLGGRIAHVWVDTGDGRRSTLDLLGPGYTLFSGPGPVVEPRDRAPLVVRRLPAIAARALGIQPGGSLLVRPDGVPVLAGAVSLREAA
jgi:2-polyprenyl-6-methoxyphenol hydroxylase-like FAD-dependent oxidoreductase